MKRIASSMLVALIALVLVVQPMFASTSAYNFATITATRNVLANQPASQDDALYTYTSVTKVARYFWGFDVWLSESLVIKLLSGQSVYANIVALNIAPWAPLVNSSIITLKSVISAVDRAQHRGAIVRFTYFPIGVIVIIVPGGVRSQ
jgi:hypothetical protein